MIRLSDSLLFVVASRHRVRTVWAIALILLLLTALAALFADASVASRVGPVLPTPVALVLGAALLVVLAGLASTALAQSARAAMLQADRRLEDLAEPVADEERIRLFKRAAWAAGWPQIAVELVIATAAALLSWRALVAAAPATVGAGIVPLDVAAVLACFPVIVVERHLAAMRRESVPEAEALARLVRVLLVCVAAGVGGGLLAHAGLSWGWWAPWLAAALILATSAELAARAVARAFVPFPVPDRVVGGVSAVAGLLRLRPPTAANVAGAIRDTLGIDVSQSWALRFVGRALLPVGLGIGGAAWLLSGLIALGTSERAVYQRFGRPVGVLGPGLHLLLPWPAGQVRRVELGIMHDLPLGRAGDQPAGAQPLERGDDRLWDRPHPGDATYLIGSETGGQQGFQVVDIDMRVVWQVGVRDEDAMAFLYDSEAPAAVIRGLAGRQLAERFAGSTLPAVLVEDRSAFIAAFRARLQGECDALRLGVHVAAVIVEAVHPPAGAAAAYHAVQASELQARVAIAEARGAAIETQTQAAQDAAAVQDSAAAAAAEIVAAAKTDASAFDADLTAWGRDRSAFLLERRLQQIGKVLPTRDTIIVDHRLGRDALPLLDLRGTTALP